jgi:hypothetical protein
MDIVDLRHADRRGQTSHAVARIGTEQLVERGRLSTPPARHGSDHGIDEMPPLNGAVRFGQRTDGCAAHESREFSELRHDR